MRWPRTVRARCAAAAALTMALVLAVGGGWLYTILRANLLDNTTGRTELAARKVAAQADAGGLPDLLPAPSSGVDLVLVLDPAGRVVATSRRSAEPAAASLAARLTSFRPPPGQDSASGIVTGSRAAGDAGGKGGERSDVVVVRATPPGGAPRYVYALTVLSDVDDATHAIALGLLASAPPLIALAAAIAWAVTGLALRPVSAIRTELAAVTGSALHRRVPDPAGGDEIALLARTVNTTLDRLEEAVTRQRQFAADASHELRNPIAAVRSQLEVVLTTWDLTTRELTTPELTTRELTAPESRQAARTVRAGTPGSVPREQELRDGVRSALADTRRLQRIATDLLLLARLDSRPEPAREPVDLALLAAEEAARRPRTRVPVTVVAPGPVPVRADPAQWERLLANLVDNALRYADSEVRITARSARDRAVLEVADDGPGIPEAAREQVFTRFARLDTARDRGRGGSGLGLAIAREIARAHGGDLTADDAEHGGARLVATLPTAPGSPTPAPHLPPAPRSSPAPHS
ncbi:two-component histidine kinase [Streptomyces sp. NBRC 110611]|uniref:sensor histidine kinase n=1 Tax=Streptomyces sp. NBRC 110611 TaxID=1621259 RepID=UPI000834BAAD|nr:HAMP domain-containing sensor histidine kinase [Streptomyces sp. NBRC 110611]GAU71060.1 two-component histidine kinase [Streptomyces sp. NBRC 110611]